MVSANMQIVDKKQSQGQREVAKQQTIGSVGQHKTQHTDSHRQQGHYGTIQLHTWVANCRHEWEVLLECCDFLLALHRSKDP